MYQTYGQIYNGQNPRYKSFQTYLSDIQPCNRNMPVGSITCPDYLPSCKPDSVNNSTNNTVDCKMRLFPPNWPYREFKYFENSRPDQFDSKYDWIKETYVNSRINRPYSCKTSPYQGSLQPYMNMTNIYNPKFNQTTS